MACNITTGLTLGATTISSTSTCLVNSPGKVILFSPTTLSGTDRSATFTVTPGMAVLIDAYNMVEDLAIYVNRVVVTSECITSSSACGCNPKLSQATAPTIVFRERMTIGEYPDDWKLIKYSSDTAEVTTTDTKVVATTVDETTTTQTIVTTDTKTVEQKSRLQLLITLPGTYELELEDTTQQLGSLEVEYQAFKISDVGHLPDAYYGGVI